MPDYPNAVETEAASRRRMEFLAESQRIEAMAVSESDRLRRREVAALERIASALDRLAENHGAAS